MRRLSRATNLFFTAAQQSTFFPALAVVALLLSTSTDYYLVLEGRHISENLLFNEQIVGDKQEVAEASGALEIQRKFHQLIYLLILLISVLNTQRLLQLFISMPVLALIPLYTLTTAFQSSNPGEVVQNTILILIATLAAAVTAINFQGKHAGGSHKLLVVFFVSLLLHQSVSILIIETNGVGVFELISSGLRTGGITNSPNNLGNNSVIGIWAAMSLIFSKQSTKLLRFACIISLVIFEVNILMSGSGTGVAISLVVVLSMLALYVITRFDRRKQVIFGTALAIVLLVSAVPAFFFISAEDILVSTTESLGKDATFTGRTDIWSTGLSALAAKPWFGWGFDGHTTVFSNIAYDVDPMPHYHNGFVDTAVAGGIILLLLTVILLWKYMSLILKLWDNNEFSFSFATAFIMLVGLNLTEYQLLRPHSQLWLVFLCLLFTAAVQYDRMSGASANRGRKARKARARKKNSVRSVEKSQRRFRF